MACLFISLTESFIEKTFNFDEAKFIDFVFFLDLTLDIRPKTFTSSCLFFFLTKKPVLVRLLSL